MSRKLQIILFAIRHLRKLLRLCSQLVEEWFKLETCQSDKVGVN